VADLRGKWSTIPKAAPHRGDGKCFIVRSDEKLAALVEVEAAIQALLNFCCESVAKLA
jgi:hypothetical protein